MEESGGKTETHARTGAKDYSKQRVLKSQLLKRLSWGSDEYEMRVTNEEVTETAKQMWSSVAQAIIQRLQALSQFVVTKFLFKEAVTSICFSIFFRLVSISMK